MAAGAGEPLRAALMRPWRLRRLTAGERALGLEVFGSELDAHRVRVWSCPPLAWTTGRPFCAGGWLLPRRTLLVYPPAMARADFAEATLGEQGVFVHELTHAWQSQQGVNLLRAKLSAGDGPAAYAYRLTPDCRWDGFNIEQQAMVVQHDFLRRRGRAAPHPEEAYLAVLPFAPAAALADTSPAFLSREAGGGGREAPGGGMGSHGAPLSAPPTSPPASRERNAG